MISLLSENQIVKKVHFSPLKLGHLFRDFLSIKPRDVVEPTFFEFEFFRVLENQFESSSSLAKPSPKISSEFQIFRASFEFLKLLQEGQLWGVKKL